MNYFLLKTAVDAIRTNFICPKCSNHVHDQSLFLWGIRENSLDVKIICPHCSTESQVHAELNQMMMSGNLGTEGEKFMNHFFHAKEWLSEKDIQEVENTLKNTMSVQDFIDPKEK